MTSCHFGCWTHVYATDLYITGLLAAIGLGHDKCTHFPKQNGGKLVLVLMGATLTEIYQSRAQSFSIIVSHFRSVVATMRTRTQFSAILFSKMGTLFFPQDLEVQLCRGQWHILTFHKVVS